MDYLWQGYLEQIVNLDEITQLVVYTDQYRYWLISGLLDLAEQNKWTISLQLIEEITDEEGMEIRQGLSFLQETTLLVAIFSDRNPIIQELMTIFPLLSSPFGYTGTSIIGQLHLPDQYLPTHLQTDLFQSKELENELRLRLKDSIEITDDYSTYLEAEVDSLATFPYVGEKHSVLPATELIVGIVPETMNGTLHVRRAIGSYSEHDELIDPFGMIDKPLELLVEEGKIVEIQGNPLVTDRLLRIIDLPHSTKTVQLSFGLSQHNDITGFIDHDRLAENVLTVSWIDDNDNHLEFVIGSVSLQSHNK